MDSECHVTTKTYHAILGNINGSIVSKIRGMIILLDSVRCYCRNLLMGYKLTRMSSSRRGGGCSMGNHRRTWESSAQGREAVSVWSVLCGSKKQTYTQRVDLWYTFWTSNQSELSGTAVCGAFSIPRNDQIKTGLGRSVVKGILLNDCTCFFLILKLLDTFWEQQKNGGEKQEREQTELSFPINLLVLDCRE